MMRVDAYLINTADFVRWQCILGREKITAFPRDKISEVVYEHVYYLRKRNAYRVDVVSVDGKKRKLMHEPEQNVAQNLAKSSHSSAIISKGGDDRISHTPSLFK